MAKDLTADEMDEVIDILAEQSAGKIRALTSALQGLVLHFAATPKDGPAQAAYDQACDLVMVPRPKRP